MYVPKEFSEKDEQEIMSFIKAHSFGILISNVDGKPWGTHIPFEFESEELGSQVLSAHISKANPQAKQISDGQEVLCIFTGPHAFVSSSWYNHDNASTWNYTSVHVYGRIKLLNEEQTYNSVRKLVQRYESKMENPVYLEDLPPEVTKYLKGIVAFYVEVEEMQAAYKLSQNRDDEDFHNIIRNLDKSASPEAKATAERMKNLR